MTESQRPRGLGAAARVTALAASVMDLHVRMALQEVDREKRRLISGGLFLAIGGTSMLLALLAGALSGLAIVVLVVLGVALAAGLLGLLAMFFVGGVGL